MLRLARPAFSCNGQYRVAWLLDRFGPAARLRRQVAELHVVCLVIGEHRSLNALRMRPREPY